jgi:hypothetical protein
MKFIKARPKKCGCINWHSAWWIKHVMIPIVVKLNPFGILPFIIIEFLMQMLMVEFHPDGGFVDDCKSGV